MIDFATLQARVNAVTLAHLGDSATLDGVAVRGTFVSDPATTLGMLCDKPIFDMPAADAGVAPRGKTLVVNGNSYKVSVAHKADSNGFRMLELDLI